MSRTIQRVRYPPFESEHMVPSNLPISEAIVEIPNRDFTNFRIGNENDWLVEWKEIQDEDYDRVFLDCEVTNNPPDFLTRTRTGWFIDPDPLHNISRRLILPTVLLLIFSLFVHAIEPVLASNGLIGNIVAGSIQIGPLEYPRLLFYTFPLFLMPLLFRTVANFRDISRQSFISKKPYQDPKISMKMNRGNSKFTINNIDTRITPSRARLQVGVVSPERSSVLYSLGRIASGQPSPGMSTRLPDKRVSLGDEVGSGVGESTPMQSESKKNVILEPLRIMSSGKWCTDVKADSECKIEMPDGDWPGSVYSSLVAVHWELIIEFIQPDGRKIKWVSPITMPHPDEDAIIEEAPVISGRAEMSNF